MPSYQDDQSPATAEIQRPVFRGFPRSNSTQVPDVFFDWLMAFMTKAELLVCLYLIRRTAGFKRDWDGVSMTQLREGIVKKTGERLDCGTQLTEKSIRDAVKSLVEKNLLVIQPQYGPDGRQRENLYGLRWEDTLVETATLPLLDFSRDPLPETATPPLLEIATHNKQLNNQQVNKRQVYQSALSSGSSSDPRWDQTALIDFRRVLQTISHNEWGAPEPETISTIIRASNGAAPDALKVFLLDKYYEGYKPGTRNAPKGWGWYVTVVKTEFEKARRGPVKAPAVATIRGVLRDAG